MLSSILSQPHQLSVFIAMLLSLVWFGLYWFSRRSLGEPFGNVIITSFWLATFGMLLLNGTTIIEHYPEGHHLHRRWYLQAEGLQNIPTLFATGQLIFAGALAFTLAISGRNLSRLHRVFWSAFGFGFYTLAADEILLLHERTHSIYVIYISGALILFAAAVWLYRRQELSGGIAPLLWIFGGMFVASVGGVIIDEVPHLQCWRSFDVCFILGYWEESAELLGVLSAIVGLCTYFGLMIPAQQQKSMFRVIGISFFIPVILLRAMDWQIPNIELQTIAEPVKIESDLSPLELLGYRMDDQPSQDRLVVSLYLRSTTPITERFGLSIQVLDQATGQMVIKKDQWVHTEVKNWVAGRIYQEKFVLPLPAPTRSSGTITHRALWSVVSLWRQVEDEYELLPLHSPDQPQLSETQVVLREFVIREEAAVSWPAAALAHRFENGFVLRGVEMPERAQAGDTLSVTMSWEAGAGDGQDWVQFLHFVGEESGALWNHDQPPLGARLPTRMWYEGMRDTEIWEVALPEELAPGRYAVYTGLYRLSDLARLGVKDGGGLPWPEARVPLGQLIIGE